MWGTNTDAKTMGREKQGMVIRSNVTNLGRSVSTNKRRRSGGHRAPTNNPRVIEAISRAIEQRRKALFAVRHYSEEKRLEAPKTANNLQYHSITNAEDTTLSEKL